MSPTFPKSEYLHRISVFQNTLRQQDIDIAVINTPENVCYLVGHETPGYYTYQSLIVPAEGEPLLLMRETEVVNGQFYTYLDNILGYKDTDDPLQFTIQTIEENFRKPKRIGMESNSWFLTPLQYTTLKNGLKAEEVIEIDAIVAEQRVIKSEREIEIIREAAKITNIAMAAGARAAKPGVRENQVAAEIFSTLVSNGSEYLGMEPFVASGPRAGTIHASWSDRVIQEGEGVLLELAAAKGRYHAPLMHTVWTGELPDLSNRMAVACRAARDAGIERIKPGSTPAEVHNIVREVIGEHDLLSTYRKRSGYSFGIAFAPDWGEGHILSLKETEHRPFEPGMVVHIVPTLREVGVAGQGFSASVLVTENGHEILTSCDITTP